MRQFSNRADTEVPDPLVHSHLPDFLILNQSFKFLVPLLEIDELLLERVNLFLVALGQRLLLLLHLAELVNRCLQVLLRLRLNALFVELQLAQRGF